MGLPEEAVQLALTVCIKCCLFFLLLIWIDNQVTCSQLLKSLNSIYAHTHTYTHTNTYIHTYTRTHTHTLHTYTRTHAQSTLVIWVTPLYICTCVAITQFDVDLAKEVASRQMNDDSLQKKLWLNIAKHVIEEEQNINQWVGVGLLWSCDPDYVTHFRAMKFLSDCEFLKIEDILPFFPDFVTIDQFKVIPGGAHVIRDHVIISGGHMSIIKGIQYTHWEPQSWNEGGCGLLLGVLLCN